MAIEVSLASRKLGMEDERIGSGAIASRAQLQMKAPDSTSRDARPRRPPPRSTTVTDPKAAAVLADPRRAMFLYPFVGRERCASDVATAYGLPLNTLMYRLGRLCALGLLEVTRVEPRAGRAIRFYRATADAFFVPLTVLPRRDLPRLVDDWAQSLQAQYLESFAAALEQQPGPWGLRISREGDGRLLVAPAQRPDCFYDYFNDDAPSIIEGWFTDLHLDDADAKQFQQELAALYLRFLGRAGKRRYMLRVALAPMARHVRLPEAW
jgi:hypothetical protein